MIVPTLRRPDALRRCVQSIADADYPADRLEVVVVDDGKLGCGAMEEAVRPVRPRVEIRLVHTPCVGPAGARNAGAKQASGEVLAFTDDDSVVHAGWLRTLCAAMGGRPRKAAGGPTLNGLPDHRWSAASLSILDIVFAYYNADPRHATFLSANNLAVAREAFEEIGGFNESYRTAEDRDFCRRWLAAGNELIYAADARVYHEDALTMGGFIQQQFGYGRGAFRFLRAAAPEGQLRVVGKFYSSMPRLISALGVAGNGAKARRAALMGELALWQAANASGFAWEALRSAVRRLV